MINFSTLYYAITIIECRVVGKKHIHSQEKLKLALKIQDLERALDPHLKFQ
jgi:hypothetical protein